EPCDRSGHQRPYSEAVEQERAYDAEISHAMQPLLDAAAGLEDVSKVREILRERRATRLLAIRLSRRASGWLLAAAGRLNCRGGASRAGLVSTKLKQAATRYLPPGGAAMSYWAAAQLQPRRDALALHFLAQAGYETYAPRLRERRTVRG